MPHQQPPEALGPRPNTRRQPPTQPSTSLPAISEHYYGDYIGLWEPLWPRAATAKQAEEQQRKNIKRLRTYRKDARRRKANLKLARKLKKCKKDNRCNSPACALCDRAFQRYMVDTCETAIAKGSDAASIYIATLVPPYRLNPGSSSEELQNRFARSIIRLQGSIKGTGNIAVLGSCDLSANEHQSAKFETHYRPHIWAIFIVTGGLTKARIRKALKKEFPIRPLIDGPVTIQKYDGNLKGLAYGFKPWWSQRGRRVTQPASRDENGMTLSRQNTRARKPRSDQFAEFLLLADQIGFAGRLFLHIEGEAPWSEAVLEKLQETFSTS